MKDLKYKRIQLEGERIFLKTLGEKNATKEYCGWLNDPEVNKYLETRKTTVAQIKKYIRENNKNSNCLFLGVFFKKNGRHIGNIKLEPIDFENRKAAIGILIGNKNYQNKQIGAEAMKLLIDYGFSRLNLQEVNLGVISENKRAISCFQKIGFKTASIEKKAIRHGDKLFNRIVMSIKNENYS